MKFFTKSFILALSLFLIHSNAQSSKLIINSNDHGLIMVSIDRGPLSHPSKVVKFMDLSAGDHWIKVVRHHPSHYGSYGNQLIYKGRVRIAPKTVTQAVVNRQGRFAIRNVKQLFTGYGPSHFQGNVCGYNSCGFAHGHQGAHGNFGPSSNCGNYFSQSYSGYGTSYNNWGTQSFGLHCMSNQQFNTFKQTLRNQHFDSSRLTVAKQVISQNKFRTEQINELVRMFDFDSKRLELAKFAYANTIDKENYYTLINAFTFNSNRDELMNFIGNI